MQKRNNFTGIFITLSDLFVSNTECGRQTCGFPTYLCCALGVQNVKREAKQVKTEFFLL